MQDLTPVRAKYLAEVAAADDEAAIEAVRVTALGKTIPEGQARDSRNHLKALLGEDPKGASIILVEKGTPGMEIMRNTAVGPFAEQGDGVHGYIRFSDCRVPADHAQV